MKAVLDNLPGGFEPDSVDYNLADGVFSDARNVRFNNGDAEKCKGTQACFGSLSATAIWALNVNDNTNSFWLYGNEAILYGYDGATHAQVSSLSYAATPERGYTGGSFHGYAILNDGVNDPQSWSPSLANKIIPLANWPASTKCRVIRPFGDFLIALGITDGSTLNSRKLRWSDVAPTGALPGSWDYSDPTNQAGIGEFGQTQDALIDCLPLRGVNIVYKQFNTWLMSYIGLPDVFDLSKQLFSQSGMLSENCAIAFDGGHLVLTDSDVIIHDGTAQQSVVDKKCRKWLFNTLDPSNYQRAFVVDNPREKQTWICIPQAGDSYPSLALVIDRSSGKSHVRELGAQMACGTLGLVSGAVTAFNDAVGAFDDAIGAFDDSTFTPFSQRLVLFEGSNRAAYQCETGETFNGMPMTCYLERSNMGLTRDLDTIKCIGAVYPKLLGSTGDTFQIKIGVRDTLDGVISWTDPFDYTMGVDYRIPDVHVSGRYISINLSYGGSNTFKLAGFDVEYESDGDR